MSVQSIGQDSSSSWLTQLLASQQNQSTASQSSASSRFGLTDVASDASDSAAAATSSGSAGSGSSVGSFHDILSALLAGNGSLGYDMQTGTLTNLAASGQSGSSDAADSAGESDGLTREVTETDNKDGSASRSVKITDANGNVVGTEKTTQNADGSFTTVSTRVGPDGKTSTRTIAGENTSDGGFSITDTLTDADGKVVEKGTDLAAADGSVTRSLTRNTPDGQTLTDSESFDANGNLVSTTSSVTGASASAVAGGSASGSSASSTASSSASASASGSSSGSASGSNSSDTTTTVTTLFTSQGLEQTTTVTDATGKVLSQNTKEVPFSATADSQSYGATQGSKEGLAGLVGQYAANRYGTSRYAAQQASGETSSDQSGSLSVEA